LGNGDTDTLWPERTQVEGITDAIAMDAGPRTNCAVRSNGSVWCWGLGHHGEAGPPGSPDDVVNPVYHPTRIEGIDDAVDVQVGHEVVCALRGTGEVSCWGSDGQRGDGSGWVDHFTTSAAPVPGLTSVRKLVAGHYPMCAIKCNGELWCWGVINGKPEYSVPRRIDGVSGVVDVVLTQYPEDYGRGIRGQICVLEECGRVLCWGQNRNGQAADGTYEPVSSPHEVTGLP
jgi:alpha-tubulin suppressor-like RCC1 family protein